MKSTAIRAFGFILFLKSINGQQNDALCNEHFETNFPVSQQQPIFTRAMMNSVQELLNQNGNTPSSNNVNQYLMQTNTPPSSPSTQRIQLPPDLQQHPLQVQQYLQLQKPLGIQKALPLPQVNPQPNSLQLQFDTNPSLLPVQSQDILQPIQKPLQLQSNQPLSYQPVQSPKSLQVQEQFIAQQPSVIPQPLIFQNKLQSLDSLQAIQPIPLQQSESKSMVAKPVIQQINNNPPTSQIRVKWKSSDPQDVMNLEQSHNAQNLKFQPLQNFVNPTVEIMDNAQKSNNKPQEIPSLRYYIASPQPVSLSAPATSIPVIPSYHPVTAIPSNYKISPEETVPLIPSYNYVISTPEVPLSLSETTSSMNSLPLKPPVLTILSPPSQSTNTQLHYYNPATDSTKKANINNNSGFRYAENFQLPVPIQTNPTILAPSQSSIVSPIPVSVVRTPQSLSPYYGAPSGYPIGTIVAPAYTRHRSGSSNLKSILPLIFRLLQEKIATCGCKNDCPCECKNDSSDNELEVASGYSCKKDYGPFDSDALSVLDTVSEEDQGPECVREPKNCENVQKDSTEASDEVLEEEASDEEEVDEDEDC